MSSGAATPDGTAVPSEAAPRTDPVSMSRMSISSFSRTGATSFVSSPERPFVAPARDADGRSGADEKVPGETPGAPSDRQPDHQADRQADRQADKQADKQADRQADSRPTAGPTARPR